MIGRLIWVYVLVESSTFIESRLCELAAVAVEVEVLELAFVDAFSADFDADAMPSYRPVSFLPHLTNVRYAISERGVCKHKAVVKPQLKIIDGCFHIKLWGV